MLKIGEEKSGWKRVGVLRVDVSQGCYYPFGYGLSYLDYFTGKGVCYPVLLNWIIWGSREIWFKIRDTPRGKESGLYQMGFNEGLVTGYEIKDSNYRNYLRDYIQKVGKNIGFNVNDLFFDGNRIRENTEENFFIVLEKFVNKIRQ